MRAPRAQVFVEGAGLRSKFQLPLRNPALAVLFFLAVVTSSSPAQTTNSSTGTIYRLNEDSTFQQGCFAPCMCPVMLSSGVKGTFVLTPTGFDGQFNNYAVENVKWLVPMGDTNTLYTGQGTYKVGRGQQELSLYLQEDGGAVQHYDSGLVQEATAFPDIKVTISINGQVCFDTVFAVSASPVRLKMIPSGANVILTWPTNGPGYALQSTTNLGSLVWTTNSSASVIINGQNVVTNPISGTHQFFRLTQ